LPRESRELKRSRPKSAVEFFSSTSPTAPRAPQRWSATRGGRPYYGIVCNAGIARDNTFAALSDEDWDGCFLDQPRRFLQRREAAHHAHGARQGGRAHRHHRLWFPASSVTAARSITAPPASV
jgi:hypothetical protein